MGLSKELDRPESPPAPSFPGGLPGGEVPSRRSRAGSLALSILPAAGVLAAIALWQALVTLFAVPAYLLPAPTAVLEALVDRFPTLMGHAAHTSTAFLLGFSLAIAISFPIAVAISYSRILSALLYPLVVGLESVPKIALAPIFLIWLGFGITAQVVISALVAFFPILISTIVGLKSMPEEMRYLALSMGGGPVRTFAKVRFPYALPSIFGGLKIGVTLSVVGAVVGEFIASNQGLGYLVLFASANVQPALAFAGIILLAVVAVTAFLIVQRIEVLVVKGPRRARS